MTRQEKNKLRSIIEHLKTALNKDEQARGPRDPWTNCESAVTWVLDDLRELAR